jgi:molecular chaperone DnaK
MADSLGYSVEKTVNENRDRLPAADVSQIEAAITSLRDAAKSENLEAIRSATDVLQKASHAMAEQLYKQKASGPANQGSGATEHSDTHDDVKEGEVVDA